MKVASITTLNAYGSLCAARPVEPNVANYKICQRFAHALTRRARTRPAVQRRNANHLHKGIAAESAVQTQCRCPGSVHMF